MAAVFPLTLSDRVRAIAQAIFTSADWTSLTLDDQQKVRCASVIVMCHAEIEDSIEKACYSAAQAIEDCPPLGFAFLAWGLANSSGIEDPPKKLTAVAQFTKNYRELLSGSHGISRKYLEKMLLPIGVDLKPLNLDVEKLGTLASARGSAAHLSPFATNLQNAPSMVASDAIAAAQAAENINLAIAALESAIRSSVPPKKSSIWKRIFFCL